MASVTPGKFHLVVVSVLLTATTLAPSVTEAQNKIDTKRPIDVRGDKRDGEEWEIEQRQRWWIESRGLKQQQNAGQLRRTAIRTSRAQAILRSKANIAAGAVWRELGPSSMRMGNWAIGRVSGRINTITPHPTNDKIVYVGSANGGLWKSIDAGVGWTPIFADVGSQSIGAIHVESGTPQNVWAGTGDRNDGECSGYLSDGVFLSTNGGDTWSSRSNGMPLSTISSLITLPANANTVLAAGFGDRCNQGGDSNGGIYRSTDKGATWTQVMDRKVEDLVTIPGTNTVYASAPGSGVYRSTDGGATWTLLGANNTSSRMRLAVAPSNTSVIYALTTNTLYRSDNAGSTWTSVNSTACDGQCGYNLTLTVHPTSPQTLIIGAILLRRSIDGGVTFTTLTNRWGSTQQVHQDTHVVRYSRNDTNRIWVGSDGGIWRSDDDTRSWVNMNANLNITQYYDIVVHPTDPNIIFGGAQDNSSSIRTSSNIWDLTVVNGDGFMNTIDDTNASIVFQNGYPSGQNADSRPSVYRSTQSGAPGTFKRMSPNGLTGGGFPWVTPTDVAGGYHFIGGDYISRAITSSGTMNWNTISPKLNGTASVITAKKIGTNIHTYAGTRNGKIYYNGNAGNADLVEMTGNLPAARVSDIAIDPTNGARAYVALSRFSGPKLYRTTSGGGTWSELGAGLPNIPANAVTIDPLNLNRIFVGTDIGVYESLDGGVNFAPMGTGMPTGLIISDLEVDNSPHVLTAGTYGRGAWQIDLSSNALQTYSSSTDVTISDNSTVESTITVSNRTGNGSATTPVTVEILHTYIGDLKAELVAPDGSVYVLHNRSGGSADNINTTYSVNLSSEALNGIWRLRVNDNAAQDVGRIDRWSIIF